MQTELVADNPHRPMDLRVLAQQSQGAVAEAAAELAQGAGSWQAPLRAGSAIAAEARAALKVLDAARMCHCNSAALAAMELVSMLHACRQRRDIAAQPALPATSYWPSYLAVCTSRMTRRSCRLQ
jgi:hypothetical protein